ncbi:MAG TPA: hypothetical protein PKA80_06490 [Ignavibacteriaceae bacterium]|nr:hypothetical protein [Ignavibacteriaceae bacterium]
MSSVKKTALLLFLIILAVVIYFLPVNLPLNLSARAKILPASEWIVARNDNGQIFTRLFDNRSGLSKNYSVSNFERGDDVRLIFRSDLKINSVVTTKDTIAKLYSNEIERQLTALKGSLEVAKASLKLNQTGDKASLVKMAEEQLAFQKKNAEEQRKILFRQEQLYQKKLISQEEYEISKGTAELNDLQIAIANANLETVRTGEKTEQIDFINSQIKSFENEIAILEKRTADFNIVPAIDGTISKLSIGDTLLIIQNTDDYFLMIPVNLKNQKYISIGEQVSFYSETDQTEFYGKIISINNSVEYLLGEPVIIVTAEIKNDNQPLNTGLITECKIHCGNMSIADHIKRFFN